VKGEENKELEKIEVHTVNLYALPGGKGGATRPLFYETKDDLIPHLKLVHKFPGAFHRVRIDRGAIRFVLSGAKLAAPGLTSTGGRLPGGGEDEDRYGSEDLEEGEVVVIEAEGKEFACMVGTLLMDTGKMKKDKKGYAMDDGHYLGDHLWSLPLD
jgi:PUA domain protein